MISTRPAPLPDIVGHGLVFFFWGLVVVSYSKPYLTFDEQIDLLERRGLQLDRARGKTAVEQIGYYRLSGYWYPYRKVDVVSSAARGRPVREGELIHGANLDQVVALYDFDRRLKLVLMDAVERIEVAVRVQLAYAIGSGGPFVHRQPAAFDGKFSRPRPWKRDHESAHSEWLRRLDESTARSKEDFVAHFKAKCGGDLPIWVAVEVIDFGMMSILFEHAPRPTRDAIAEKFAVRDDAGRGHGAALANWLRVLNLVRNTCAHHARLWNRNFADQVSPSLLSGISSLTHISGLDRRGQARIYPALAITRYLLAAIAPDDSWGLRLMAVLESFPADSTVALSDMGFPRDWRMLLS